MQGMRFVHAATEHAYYNFSTGTCTCGTCTCGTCTCGCIRIDACATLLEAGWFIVSHVLYTVLLFETCAIIRENTVSIRNKSSGERCALLIARRTVCFVDSKDYYCSRADTVDGTPSPSLLSVQLVSDYMYCQLVGPMSE